MHLLDRIALCLMGELTTLCKCCNNKAHNVSIRAESEAPHTSS